MLDSLCLPLVALLLPFRLATFIKTIQPNLSCQKEFVYSLKTFISANDFDWLLSDPVKLSVSFDDAHHYINSVWLDFF